MVINQEQVEMIVRDAIATARERGLHILPGGFGVDYIHSEERWTCTRMISPGTFAVCPLGAVLIIHQPVGGSALDDDPYAIGLRQVIGVSDSWISGFWNAFDGFDRHTLLSRDWESGYTLGRKFRDELYQVEPTPTIEH